MSNENLSESFRMLDRKPIHEILSRKVFRGPFEDPVMGNIEAYRIILNKYPDFEFSGLRNE
jgi:hypothetical protein